MLYQWFLDSADEGKTILIWTMICENLLSLLALIQAAWGVYDFWNFEKV
jgi:hypothetical protein